MLQQLQAGDRIHVSLWEWETTLFKESSLFTATFSGPADWEWQIVLRARTWKTWNLSVRTRERTENSLRKDSAKKFSRAFWVLVLFTFTVRSIEPQPPPPPQPPHHHLLVSDFVRLLSSSLVHTSIPFPKCSIIFSTSYIPWFFSSCVRFLLLFPTWFSYSLSLRIFRVFFVHCFPNQRWHSPCDYLFIHSFFPPCRVKFITRVCVKAQTIL